MALVTYDNSDSSDFEDEEPSITNLVMMSKPNVSKAEVSAPLESSINGSPAESASLFNLLPQPSRTKPPPIEEEDDEFLHKKEKAPNAVKPKAQISVPSLSDFKDVEDTVKKPRQASGKKLGLLSMLPQPRNGVISTTTSKSLIPNVLKQTKPIEKKKPIPSPAVKKTQTKLPLDYSDESDNEDVQNDFFSMNKTEEPLPEIVAEIEPPEIKSSNPHQKLPAGIQSYFKQDNSVVAEPERPVIESYGAEVPSYSSYSQEEQRGSEVPLDDEAIRALCGSRGKRRREDIQIVDVDQREVLAEAREWLVKGLTEDTTKRVSSSKRRGDEPSAQQRKKHQITYLAHQAKANEAELQNQWANSRMSRKQTQSKYGF